MQSLVENEALVKDRDRNCSALRCFGLIKFMSCSLCTFWWTDGNKTVTEENKEAKPKGSAIINHFRPESCPYFYVSSMIYCYTKGRHLLIHNLQVSIWLRSEVRVVKVVYTDETVFTTRGVGGTCWVNCDPVKLLEHEVQGQRTR